MTFTLLNALEMPSLFSRKPIGELLVEGEHPNALKRALGAGDLIMLAIGAVIGAGIFGAIGTAAAGETDAAGHIIRSGAGPALVISFVLLGVACALAGLCYAELASMIPIAGSAYTYSYATLGEIFAWIIGWDLILEYVVSNVVVAIGFAAYSKAQLESFGVHLPDRWSTPVWEAGHWTGSYFNFPAFLIIFILTVLLVRGIRESAEANNVMVAIKIGAILTFLVVGGALVNPSNWKPFAPSGFGGIVTGGAIVFFTYIGFDSVSTAAEESRNPQKDLPFGIIMSLIVCTLLYVGVALVLLGMMKYTTFVSGAAAEAPVAYAMKYLGVHPLFRSVIVIGALTGMISSLLVFQYGQPRIFFAMGRDGLLPRWAAKVHPKTRVPHITTLVTGIAVAVGSLLADENEIYDLTNIGTLSAFAIVCVGVLVLRYSDPSRPRPFRVPFVWPVTVLGADAACQAGR